MRASYGRATGQCTPLTRVRETFAEYLTLDEAARRLGTDVDSLLRLANAERFCLATVAQGGHVVFMAGRQDVHRIYLDHTASFTTDQLGLTYEECPRCSPTQPYPLTFPTCQPSQVTIHTLRVHYCVLDAVRGELGLHALARSYAWAALDGTLRGLRRGRQLWMNRGAQQARLARWTWAAHRALRAAWAWLLHLVRTGQWGKR